MENFTAPELSDVIVRSRELQRGKQLDPPAEWPVVFSCRYHDVESIGCVFLNGFTTIMPNQCVPGTGPLMVSHWGGVESNGAITDIRFEWQVTRSVRENDRPIADVGGTEDAT